MWVLFWLENRGSSRTKGLACIRNERKNSLSDLFALLVLSSPCDSLLKSAFGFGGRGRGGPGAGRAGPGGARGRQRGRDEHRCFDDDALQPTFLTTNAIFIIVFSDAPGRVGCPAPSAAAAVAAAGEGRTRGCSQAAEGAQAGGEGGHFLLAYLGERERLSRWHVEEKKNLGLFFLFLFTSSPPRAR